MCYPSLFDILKALFGIEIAGFRFINTFGFFVALAFFAAFYFSRSELKRLQRVHHLKPLPIKKILGKKTNLMTVFYYVAFGFLFGYKIVGIFFTSSTSSHDYLLSSDGNWWGGWMLAAFFGYINYRDQKRSELPEPKEQTFYMEPHQHMENLFFIALVAGLLGAKIFHNLENWDSFMQDPIGSLFSFSGLTFYGGLICATLSIWLYLKKRGLDLWIFSDALCVGVLMAYGVGRFGCHFAGDGDWGITNTAPNPFSFLPNSWWASSYTNNVLGTVLEHSVFPTPLYEAVFSILLAFLLRFIARKIKITGVTFGIYLIFVGVERLLVEMIRVNPKYHIAGMAFTQAELISVCLFVAGILIIYWRWTVYKKGNLRIA